MRMIIGGVRFDTDKAVHVCQVREGQGPRDFNYIDADLYRTPRSGRFFLAGWGGAATAFSKTASDGSRYGSPNIVPLDDEEALLYAEKHASTEQIEEHFPDMIEDA